MAMLKSSLHDHCFRLRAKRSGIFGFLVASISFMLLSAVSRSTKWTIRALMILSTQVTRVLDGCAHETMRIAHQSHVPETLRRLSIRYTGHEP
jgi:hypothetical protein